MAPPDGARCVLALEGVCTGRAECWHELVGAGVGGSRTDPRNIAAACGACNTALETHPDRYRNGWKVRSSDAVRGDGGLIPATPSPYAHANRWD